MSTLARDFKSLELDAADKFVYPDCFVIEFVPCRDGTFDVGKYGK